jgi:hypothetical protein
MSDIVTRLRNWVHAVEAERGCFSDAALAYQLTAGLAAAANVAADISYLLELLT